MSISDYHFIRGEIASLNSDQQNAIEHFKASVGYLSKAGIHHRLAEEYLESGDIESGINSAEAALELNGSSANILVLLGNLYATNGSYEKSKKAFEKAVEKKEYSALLYLSVIYEKEGRIKDAILALKRSVELDPSSVHIAHYKLGNIYHGLQKKLLAKRHYSKAIEADLDFVNPVLSLHDIYKSEGRLDKAIGILSDFRSTSSNSLEISSRLAELYLSQRRLSDAYNEFSFVYNASPDDFYAPTKMGLILVEQKKYTEAEVIFKELLDRVPESDQIRFYLGAVYEELGFRQKAIDAFVGITENSTYYADAMMHAAYLNKINDQIDKAILIMEKTLETHPTIQVKIMYANLLSSQGQYDKAISILKEGIGVSDNTDLYYAIGSIYDMTGEKTKAIAFMKKVIKLEPNNVAALNYLAYTYSELNTNLERAQVLVNRALKLKPDDGYIKDTLGWILYKKGQVDDAIMVLESAYSLEPNESVIAEHLADAYHSASQIENAVLMYERAISLEVDEKNLAKIKSKLADIQASHKGYKVISAN